MAEGTFIVLKKKTKKKRKTESYVLFNVDGRSSVRLLFGGLFHILCIGTHN